MSRFIIAGKSRNLASRETGFGNSGPKSRRLISEPRTLAIDSKGRVSIPADIRRSLGLGSGSRVILDFDLEKDVIMLFGASWSYGRSGVNTSIRGCESLGPGENPGSGPEKSLIFKGRLKR